MFTGLTTHEEIGVWVFTVLIVMALAYGWSVRSPENGKKDDEVL